MEFIGGTISIFWAILKNWWWLPLPFLFYKRFIFFFLWYRVEKFDLSVKKVMLEVKIPKEIIKSIKAMDQAFLGMHGYHDVFNWKEVVLEGEYLHSLGFEIACLEGKVHFYIRCPAKARDLVESNIYAQYPEAEISLAENYTKLVPQNIPNKDWDLFGIDMINTKPSAYPLKTYIDFENDIKEEKRLDPLAGLLDGMATIGPGEYLWVQLIAKPIRTEVKWQEEGLKLVNDLVHREEEEPARWKPIVQEAADVLITGQPPSGPPEEKKEEGFLPPEMKLTPGERATVLAIEGKISKFGYQCSVRFMYLGKRDVFFKPKARIPYGLYKTVSSEGLGGLKPWLTTLPKVQWFFREIRQYGRKRAMFRRYVRRFPPLFPQDFTAATFVLTTDELATLYHFPGRMVAPAPSVVRLEAKKGEAPPELPVE